MRPLPPHILKISAAPSLTALSPHPKATPQVFPDPYPHCSFFSSRCSGLWFIDHLLLWLRALRGGIGPRDHGPIPEGPGQVLTRSLLGDRGSEPWGGGAQCQGMEGLLHCCRRGGDARGIQLTAGRDKEKDLWPWQKSPGSTLEMLGLQDPF